MPVQDRIREIVEWAADNKISLSGMYDVRDYHDRFCRHDSLANTTIALQCVTEAMEQWVHNCISHSIWTSHLEEIVAGTAIEIYNKMHD